MPEIVSIQGYGPKKDGSCTYTVSIKVEAPLTESFILKLEDWLREPPSLGSVQQDGVDRPMRTWFLHSEVAGQVGAMGTVFVSDGELRDVPDYTAFCRVVGEPLARLKGLIHDHWQRLRLKDMPAGE